MIFVLALFALGLGYAGWKNKLSRPLLLSVALLNVGAATLMVVEHHPYTYTLKSSTSAPGID